ncbi:N-acetylmuramoyl-L-alanine amidase, partial [Bacillus pseudomycoides]
QEQSKQQDQLLPEQKQQEQKTIQQDITKQPGTAGVKSEQPLGTSEIETNQTTVKTVQAAPKTQGGWVNRDNKWYYI